MYVRIESAECCLFPNMLIVAETCWLWPLDCWLFACTLNVLVFRHISLIFMHMLIVFTAICRNPEWDIEWNAIFTWNIPDKSSSLTIAVLDHDTVTRDDLVRTSSIMHVCVNADVYVYTYIHSYTRILHVFCDVRDVTNLRLCMFASEYVRIWVCRDIYIFIYIYMRIHTYIHTYIYTYLHAYKHIKHVFHMHNVTNCVSIHRTCNTHAHDISCIYVSTCVHTTAQIHIYALCIYVCMYVCIYIHIYIYTHTYQISIHEYDTYIHAYMQHIHAQVHMYIQHIHAKIHQILWTTNGRVLKCILKLFIMNDCVPDGARYLFMYISIHVYILILLSTQLPSAWNMSQKRTEHRAHNACKDTKQALTLVAKRTKNT